MIRWLFVGSAVTLLFSCQDGASEKPKPSIAAIEDSPPAPPDITVELTNPSGRKKFSYRCDSFTPKVSKLADIDVFGHELSKLAKRDGGILIDYATIGGQLQRSEFAEAERGLVSVKCKGAVDVSERLNGGQAPPGGKIFLRDEKGKKQFSYDCGAFFPQPLLMSDTDVLVHEFSRMMKEAPGGSTSLEAVRIGKMLSASRLRELEWALYVHRCRAQSTH